MELQTTDLALPLFFLVALVLVARSRRQLAAESAQGYRYISGGLVIIALMIVSRLYQTIGAFRSVPLLSDPVFYRLFLWIGVITGLTMLVSGISNWLPLSKAHRRLDRKQPPPPDFIRRVEQLVGVERRLPVILSRTLQYMVEHFFLRSGAVYLFSRGQEKPVLLSSSGPEEVSDADLRRISFDLKAVDDLSDNDSHASEGIVAHTPPGIARPDLTLPVTAGGKLSALFLLWSDGRHTADDNNLRSMKIAVDIVSRKLELKKLQVGEAFRKRQQQWLQSFDAAVDPRKPVKDKVSKIAAWFTSMIPVQLVSVIVKYDRTNVQRFSAGGEGPVLAEKRVDILSHGAFLKQVMDSQRPLVINDTSGKTSVPVDKMILASGMKSLVAFRLESGSEPRAAMILASKDANRFGSRDIELVESAIPLLSRLVSDEIHRYRISVAERRIALTNTFLADCGRAATLQGLFEQAAGLLSKEIRTSMVRISTFEYDGTFLKSRALALLRPVEGLTPANGHMILSLMPYHTLVRETGRLMLINQQQTDRKITEAEATQICRPDLRSVLLVPITIGRETLAVISLAEMRSWSRYHYDQADVLFVASMASVLSVAIQLALAKKGKVLSRLGEGGAASAVLPDPALKGRIKSSLSSILGSVEMIRSHNLGADAGTKRYLSIIDRSAQKINDYVAEKSPP